VAVTLAEQVAAELETARHRTLLLLENLDHEALCHQHSSLMSPLVWDLAHIGNYEDLWLLRALGQPGLGAHYDEIYDAFRHPRRSRSQLALLGPDAARQYLVEVRQRALNVLEGLDLAEPNPLTSGGFVHAMVVQHEHQHDETILATLSLIEGDGYRPITPPSPVGSGDRALLDGEVLVEGGPFIMGTDTEPWAYDNERPAHAVNVAAFYIDVTPVTNGQYQEFVAAGGYHQRQWWSEAGWSWRNEAQLESPQFWIRSGDGWRHRRFGWIEPLPANEPVQHVCWYEADAYARWAGKRLPTEAEWEKAAAWDPATRTSRRFPWGHQDPTDELANLGGASFGPHPVGAHPAGVSPSGCHDLIGGVWEWTSSDFLLYPGFAAFPYREYSEVFHGPDYKVLRGGSWATHRTAIRSTFRNWDYPIRRQIFAGFRCARDAR
jgi:iron(II)-dependent oxidoreductase